MNWRRWIGFYTKEEQGWEPLCDHSMGAYVVEGVHKYGYGECTECGQEVSLCVLLGNLSRRMGAELLECQKLRNETREGRYDKG